MPNTAGNKALHLLMQFGRPSPWRRDLQLGMRGPKVGVTQQLSPMPLRVWQTKAPVKACAPVSADERLEGGNNLARRLRAGDAEALAHDCFSQPG